MQTKETALSIFLAISVSVQRISMYILNEYFCISPSVYKSMISKDLFYSLRPCFFLFLPKLFIFCFVMVKVPQSLRTLLIHTNDCPLFDIIENACTSCWEEWKKKEAKVGNQKCRISWFEMELVLLGKENIVLIEVDPTELLGKKKTGDTYALVQRILNSYINYLGNIARKRIDGAVFIECCLLKVLPFFMASVI